MPCCYMYPMTVLSNIIFIHSLASSLAFLASSIPCNSFCLASHSAFASLSALYLVAVEEKGTGVNTENYNNDTQVARNPSDTTDDSRIQKFN